jgi:hypothetical protein
MSSWLMLRYNTSMCQMELRKLTGNVSQDSYLQAKNQTQNLENIKEEC